MNSQLYAIIRHIEQIKPQTQTNKKGASSDPNNWETIENLVISDSLNRTELAEASVVIDLITMKVVKDRYGKSNQETLLEYYERYQEEIFECMKLWAMASPENLEILNRMKTKNPKVSSILGIPNDT